MMITQDFCKTKKRKLTSRYSSRHKFYPKLLQDHWISFEHANIFLSCSHLSYENNL